MSTEGTLCIRGMSEEDVVEPSNWVGVGGSVLLKASYRMQWGPERAGFLPISSQLPLPVRLQASHCIVLSLCSDLCKLKYTPCLLT